MESATVEGKPDADAARTLVDSLAQAVAQNRTALLALTALKNYDNYTFTHMVNVSILTMGQARGLGIEGGLLREFGLDLDESVAVHVWDSSAEMRYMVLPERPAGTEGLGEEELAALVTRDAMIGVARVAAPQPSGAAAD